MYDVAKCKLQTSADVQGHMATACTAYVVRDSRYREMQHVCLDTARMVGHSMYGDTAGVVRHSMHGETNYKFDIYVKHIW